MCREGGGSGFVKRSSLWTGGLQITRIHNWNHDPKMTWSRTRSRHHRGYGYKWEQARELVLRRDSGLCQSCLKANRVTQASQVDHIKPRSKGGTDDEGNLQSICTPCHLAKTAEDEGRKHRPKVQIDVSGWPVGS